MYDEIIVERADGIATITLNKPPFNLASFAMLNDLRTAFDEIEAEAETRVVALRGAGDRAFSAGADLGDESRHTAETGRSFRELGRFLVERIETFPKPVISAVRGWCIGGGTGLAWAADIRIASDTAKFRAGDVYLGIIPTWSIGMVRLVHHIGRNRTLDLLLLGEDVNAARALELGLVSKVVPDAEFDAAVAATAKRLASGAPLPMQAIKQAVRAQYYDGPDRAAVLEEKWAQRILATKDAKEGMAAFHEKRQPVFTGE
ncbi:enoyl-CoA hydratase/isomerase family protein [Rhodoligotrophos defluvii]|uniref:enoyl-CoA hydratase/isomerase family protein n=1 Tax=Rhodoligotrophos defluvii TaxID=2561934 RepID=UPI0010C9BBEA|nr:enoyl-CoA hydratase/isomerase family protein [Rhodoligotrophos defluvii]